MWKLSVEDDQGNRTAVNLVRDEYTIGRAQENTVRLTERNISRRHAVLRRNGAGWNVEDQSSYNGCFVNGARVCERHALSHGDLIQVGDYRLRVIDEATEFAGDQTPTARAPLATPATTGTGEVACDRLVMIAGPTPGAQFALDADQMVIGRGEECDISINHTSVSREHAQIQRLGDGTYELIDQDSANGVRINGNELKRSLLEAHDKIELGDITLKLVPAGAGYLPRPGVVRSASDDGDAAVSVPADVFATAVKPSGLSSRQLRIAGGVAALLIIAVAGIAALRGGGNPASILQGATSSEEATALREAKGLLEEGKIEAAHEMAIRGVPERSALRESEDFRAVESRWADLLLSMASGESDPDRKRALLDEVARATTVDSTRRKKAADRLSTLAVAGVDISDLPEARGSTRRNHGTRPPPGPDGEQPPAEGAEAAPDERAVAAAPVAREVPPPPAGNDNPYGDSPPPAPKAAPKPKPPPAPQTKPAGMSGATEKATSGDRAKQIAAKDALKAKARAGRASEQEKRLLRALCRQYGDSSCSN